MNGRRSGNVRAAKAQHAGLGKKLPDPPKADDQKTATKAAELFNTNRTYVNQAVKMKQTAPEVFERVKAGTMTILDGRRGSARWSGATCHLGRLACR